MNTTGRPKIWAHRGASGSAPENTLEAFERAVALKADGIELDVQRTKDGIPIVIHDEKLGRTCNAEGYVKDRTLAELKALSFNKTCPSMSGTIMTLREVYELIKPTELVINTELKTSIIPYDGLEEQILSLAAELSMEDRIIYSSFSRESCVRLMELNPACKVGLLCSDATIQELQFCKEHGLSAIHPDLKSLQNQGFLENARALGLKIHVWTVNDPLYLSMCQRAQVDAVITNVPDVARTVIN